MTLYQNPCVFFVFATFAKYKYRMISVTSQTLYAVFQLLRGFYHIQALCIFAPRISRLEVTIQNVFGKSSGLFGIGRRVRDHFIGVFREQNSRVAIFFVFHWVKDRGCLLSRQRSAARKAFRFFSVLLVAVSPQTCLQSFSLLINSSA